VKAAFDLARRIEAAPVRGSPRSPARGRGQRRLASDLKGKKKEHFRGCWLDTRNRLIRTAAGHGQPGFQHVHPREVFKEAIRPARHR